MSLKLLRDFRFLAPRPMRHLRSRRIVARNFYAVQFHPEVHHTPNGTTLYENFVRLAGFTGDWTMGAYREEAIRKIREQVGDKPCDLRAVRRRRSARLRPHCCTRRSAIN